MPPAPGEPPTELDLPYDTRVHTGLEHGKHSSRPG